METPSISTRSNRTKFVAILALAVLGSLAVSYAVFSATETELLVKAPTSQNVSAVYASWKKQFNTTYGGPEDAQRLKIFTKTFNSINTVNAKNLTYKLGLNQFSAMSDEEFASTKLGLNSKLFRASGNATKLPTANLKDSVDWTGKGAVQHVKNQGSCGSCWAFSAVGALEGLSALSGKGLQDFSEQELVDCSRSYGNNGCSGGLMTSAFRYVKDKGITTQDQYPYKAVDGTCKAITGNKFKIGGYVEVPANSGAQLKAALNKQPVAVAVQASATIFRNYKTGVLTGAACGTALNHGVLAVGYETTGTPYYKVKNSWGTTWGDQGYIKIGIEEGAGVCGIHKMSSYPTA